MCYHYSLVATPDELAARYRRRNDEIENYRKTYHISAFTHTECPVITTDPEIQMFRWGLVPFWTKNVEEALTIRNRTINARSESVFSKPAFREAVKKKIPYLISLKQEGLFSFAGIYDTWHNPVTDEQLHTFSILTTDANPMMRYIHNTNFRMPVILHENEESLWLDPMSGESVLKRLFTPYDESEMQAYRVDPGFLKKNPHDPGIVERIGTT